MCHSRDIQGYRDSGQDRNGGRLKIELGRRRVACRRFYNPGAIGRSAGGTRDRWLACERVHEPVRTKAGHRPEPSDRELTSRELAVLRMLADGEVTRGIAEQLNYSERTVKNIVRDVLVKLNCRTRAHAAALATRRGLI